MNQYIIICLVALLGSALTLFSGFGLGTILTPVFAIFFPIDLAIALTAIVHFLNNIFKLFLVGKHTDKNIILRFGITAIVASFIGAYTLKAIGELPSIYEYQLFDRSFQITPIKLTIGIILGFFALFDIIPKLNRIEFDKKYLPLGGILTGFFGGLSGIQGALRSAFLIRANLSKEAYIATGVVIACLVDVSRLTVYSSKIISNHEQINYTLVLFATLSAFIGAYFGNKLIKKVTITFLQYLVAIMLLVFSVLMSAGII